MRSKSGALLTCVLLCAPLPAAAQDAEPPAALARYDDEALWLRQRNGTRLVRGASARELARIGIFGADLRPFVARSDSAVVLADRFRVRTRNGAIVNLLGVAALVTALSRHDDDIDTTNGVLIGGGVVGILVGGAQMRDGWNALQRSLWLHNRSLVGRPPD